MHRLHLVRHAKSSWSEPGLADRERPLNGRGRRACRQMAAYLPRAEVRPHAIITSPATRARQTLDGLAPGLPHDAERWTENRLYGAAGDEILDLIRELPEGIGEVMLIGHNPGLGELATRLAGEAGPPAARIRSKFPTAALASFAVASRWVRTDPTVVALERFMRPKDLA